MARFIDSDKLRSMGYSQSAIDSLLAKDPTIQDRAALRKAGEAGMKRDRQKGQRQMARSAPYIGAAIGGIGAGIPGAMAGGALGKLVENMTVPDTSATPFLGGMIPGASNPVPNSGPWGVARAAATGGLGEGAGRALMGTAKGLGRWFQSASLRPDPNLVKEYGDIVGQSLEDRVFVGLPGQAPAKVKALISDTVKQVNALVDAATAGGKTTTVDAVLGPVDDLIKTTADEARVGVTGAAERLGVLQNMRSALIEANTRRTMSTVQTGTRIGPVQGGKRGGIPVTRTEERVERAVLTPRDINTLKKGMQDAAFALYKRGRRIGGTADAGIDEAELFSQKSAAGARNVLEEMAPGTGALNDRIRTLMALQDAAGMAEGARPMVSGWNLLAAVPPRATGMAARGVTSVPSLFGAAQTPRALGLLLRLGEDPQR